MYTHPHTPLMYTHPHTHINVHTSIFQCSEQLLVLHQLFLRGLHSRLDKWPVVSLGKDREEKKGPPGGGGGGAGALKFCALCMQSHVAHITLHYITSHYITLHHITLYYITLHHITSHYITSHHITSNTHIHIYTHTHTHHITSRRQRSVALSSHDNHLPPVCWEPLTCNGSTYVMSRLL